MTTIAYKDGIMTSDSAATTHRHVGDVTKIFEVEGHLVGLAGELSAQAPFVEWVRATLKRGIRAKISRLIGGGPQWLSNLLGVQGPEWGMLYNASIETLIAAPDGSVYTIVDGQWIKFESDFYAIGSGGDFAIGAMAAGFDAYQAVQVAAAFDPGTRGPFQAIGFEPFEIIDGDEEDEEDTSEQE